MTPTRALRARALSGVAVLSLSFGGAVGAFLLSAGPASADTIPVTNTADDGDVTSLRGVLLDANDGDVIVLTAGATYQLTRCEPVDPNAQAIGSGQITIGGAVTIEGNGATIEQTCPNRVLFTEHAITLNDVTITGGDEEGQGGGLLVDSKSPIVLNGATFTGNSALSGGGGIGTFGDITAQGCTFTDNHAVDDGADGGGVQVSSEAATTTFEGCTFSGNTADGYGGAFEQQDTEAVEPIAEADDPGPFVLTFTNSTISGNTASGDGGGGIDTESNATITIEHSTVSGNDGGGGGGVAGYGASTVFTANASTFSGNSTQRSGSAVYLSGPSAMSAADLPVSQASFTNSTITGNTEGAFGAVSVGGFVAFNQVTMTNNTSLGEISGGGSLSGRGGVGALADEEGDAANIAAIAFDSANSVVAQPQGAPNCIGLVGNTDDLGYNFSDDTSCGFTAATSSVKTPNDPVLGALANNGGPTQTLLPLTGSPLLDAIPPASCGAPVDQREVTRPQGPGCDIGAVEVEYVAPAPAAAVTPKFTG